MKWESKHDEFLVDVAACMLTLLTTMVAYSTGMTLSSLAGTSYEPLLISTSAMTSLSLFATRKWRIPAMLIMALAAFSVHMYPTIHNVTAGLFYVASFYLIARDRRLKVYGLGIIASVVAIGHSLLAFEIVANLTIVMFHLHYAMIKYSLK